MQTVALSEQNRDKVRAALTEWGIPQELAEEASEHRTVVIYPKGAILFLQGSSSEFLFCILSGFVSIYFPLADGSRVLVSLAGANEIVGDRAFANERGKLSQCFEAQARTRSEVALFSRTQLTNLLGQLDSAKLLSMLNDQQAAASRAILNWVNFLGLNYRCRLQLVLASLARRFGVKDTRGTMLIPELGHEDFAEMINCSRPMASKLINEMAEKRQIARSGKKYILLEKFGLDGGDQAQDQSLGTVQRYPSLRAVGTGQPGLRSERMFPAERVCLSKP